MSSKVFVAGPIDPDALSLLQSTTQVLLGYGPDAVLLESVLADVEAILATLPQITVEHIENAPRLRVIAKHGVGTDRIDVGAATRCGVAVLITPAANATTVAEHVIALALAVTRRVVAGHTAVLSDRFGQRNTVLGHDLSGKRLGVLGLGRIGREVARIAHCGFRMRVTGYDPQLQPGRHDTFTAAPSIIDVLQNSDVVSVCLPLLPQTRGLLGESEFAAMPTGSIVIQAARGGVVDEQALADAVSSGHLAGAGVDVFDVEPPPPDHPYFSVPDIVVTPHIAGLTEQAVRRMSSACVEGILDVLSGAGVADLERREDWKLINPGFADALDHHRPA